MAARRYSQISDAIGSIYVAMRHPPLRPESQGAPYGPQLSRLVRVGRRGPSGQGRRQRSPTPFSTPCSRRTRARGWPARPWSTPAWPWSPARSPPAPPSTTPRSCARPSATSATTTATWASTATPAPCCWRSTSSRPDIAQGVDEGSGLDLDQGAGDQGLMYGYATNETRRPDADADPATPTSSPSARRGAQVRRARLAAPGLQVPGLGRATRATPRSPSRRWCSPLSTPPRSATRRSRRR